MLHGLVPALQSDPNMPYWQGANTASTCLDQLTDQCKWDIGVCPNHRQSINEQDLEKCYENTAQDARQMYRLMNHLEITLSDCTPPQPVQGSIPDDVNAYSDGSLTHPTIADYSMCSAGAWWPNRQIDIYPKLSKSTRIMTWD